MPQKSTTGESTITSGVKTTVQMYKLVNCDHIGHFSQNRDKYCCSFGFSLSFGPTFICLPLSMPKLCGAKATLVNFTSQTVPRIHKIKRTYEIASLAYNFQLIGISYPSDFWYVLKA